MWSTTLVDTSLAATHETHFSGRPKTEGWAMPSRTTSPLVILVYSLVGYIFLTGVWRGWSEPKYSGLHIVRTPGYKWERLWPSGKKRRTRSLGCDFSTTSPCAGELKAHRNSDKAYQIHHNQHQLRFFVSAGFLSDFWEKTLECCV